MLRIILQVSQQQHRWSSAYQHAGLLRTLPPPVLPHVSLCAGVEALDCYCVDNALARLGDPLFLGYCHAQSAQVGARVVAKAYPDEKVGRFAELC